MTKNILVVDDSPFQLENLTNILKGLRYENVSRAASGKEALEVISNLDSLYLVISDLNMPEMDGLEFCKEFSKIEKFQNVFFAMATSEMRPDQRAMGKEVGVKAWIVKPFSQKGVSQILDIIADAAA